jgi:hypothetical protein
VSVHEGGEEQGGVGDAPGDDDVGPALERLDDRTGTEAASGKSAGRSSGRPRRSSPTTTATVKPDRPKRSAAFVTIRPAATGLIPPAFVMTFVRPSSTAGSVCMR